MGRVFTRPICTNLSIPIEQLRIANELKVAGVFFSGLNAGDVREVDLYLAQRAGKLVVIIQGCNYGSDPITQGAGGFQQAAAVVWP